MKALILAAGYATRLYPLTKDRPKPLLEIGGKAVLEHILDHLSAVDGLSQVLIVVNQKFYSQFEKWRAGTRSVQEILLVNDGSTHEENRLGAVGDIAFCLKTEKITDDLLVIAGDNLFDCDLRSFVVSAQKKSPFCSMMVYDIKDFSLASHYGIVGLGRENRLISFEEKPKKPSSTLAAMGVYYFPKQVLAYFDRYLKGGSPLDAPGFFIRWLQQKETIYGYPCEGVWYDIGDSVSYRRAAEKFELKKEKR